MFLVEVAPAQVTAGSSRCGFGAVVPFLEPFRLGGVTSGLGAERYQRKHPKCQRQQSQPNRKHHISVFRRNQQQVLEPWSQGIACSGASGHHNGADVRAMYSPINFLPIGTVARLRYSAPPVRSPKNLMHFSIIISNQPEDVHHISTQQAPILNNEPA